MIICTPRIHCVPCRTNAKFRDKLVAGGIVPMRDFVCPFGVTVETAASQTPAPPPPPNPRPIDDRIAKGRAAWLALHAAASAGTITEEWLIKTFLPMVPQYGCACLRKWRAILAKYPLRPADQFAWSVDVHNAVNVDLGKPVLTVEQAQAAMEAAAQDAKTAGDSLA